MANAYSPNGSLEFMKEGDIYHWCDIGCHFNTKGKQRLKDYINIVSKDEIGFLGFDYKSLDNVNFFKIYISCTS